MRSKPKFQQEDRVMSDPLQTAARVLEAMSLYAGYHGTAGRAYQDRKKEFAAMLRAAGASASEHNLYGKQFIEKLAALVEEV
jgi:hypothetical protein